MEKGDGDLSEGIFIPENERREMYDFNSGFKSCCKTLRSRVRGDWDAVVAITGEEGVSKSTLANQIGFHTDKNYTLEKNVLYSPNEVSMVKAIRGLPRFSVVNADEAVKILHKQQWWMQTFINKFYRLCRQDNKISLLCMPRFSEFNEGFRNHRIRLWLHVIDRGIAIAFSKDWSPFIADPWHFKESEKMINNYTRRRKSSYMDLNAKIKVLSRCPAFLDIITFPDLPETLRIRYKQLAAEHKYEGMMDEMTRGGKISSTDRKTVAMGKLILELKEKNNMKTSQIAHLTGYSQTTINNIVSKMKWEEKRKKEEEQRRKALKELL